MGQPAAKKGDQITAIDTHLWWCRRPVHRPWRCRIHLPEVISGGLSGDVNIMGMPAATVDSTADNTPAHIPTPPGTSFSSPPSNKGTIKIGQFHRQNQRQGGGAQRRCGRDLQ